MKAATCTNRKPKMEKPAPNNIETEAPTAAPADTPNTYESAIGFLNTPWYTTPDAAKAAPTTTPAMIRGRRIWRMIAV